MKQTTTFNILLQGCPIMFEALIKYLGTLDYRSKPSYHYFRYAFVLILQARGIGANEPMDWETRKRKASRRRHHRAPLIGSCLQKSLLSHPTHKAVYDKPSRPSNRSEITEVPADASNPQHQSDENSPTNNPAGTPTADTQINRD